MSETTWTAEEMTALKQVLDELEAQRQQDAQKLAFQDNELIEKQKYILQLERHVSKLEGQLAEAKDNAHAMWQAGMQTEQEHQNALSRLVMRKHQEEVDSLKAQLQELRKTGCYPMPQIASGVVTAIWNTPEEDEAWAHLSDDNRKEGEVQG